MVMKIDIWSNKMLKRRPNMTQQRLDQILAERQKLSEQMKPLYEALNQLQQQDKKLAIEMAKIVDPVVEEAQ